MTFHGRFVPLTHSRQTDSYEIYLRECDRLAETLYVANFKRPEVRAYAFERSGAEFIMAVPGPADTAVGTRIMLYENYR